MAVLVGRLAQLTVRQRLALALSSTRFDLFITFLIVLNAVVLGLLTYNHGETVTSRGVAELLIRIDVGIIVIFMAEIMLKIYAFGGKFFKSGWNWFDFLIVSIGILGSSYPLSVLRALRVLRLFRLIKRAPTTRSVVEGFFRALPGIGAVFLVMVIVMFVFAVLGTCLFKDVSPELFGSLENSAFTLFTILTLEGWPDVAREVMSEVRGAWLFFIFYIVLNSFVVLNLMIAVTIEAMQRDYNKDADEDRDHILEELIALRADIKAMREAQSGTS